MLTKQAARTNRLGVSKMADRKNSLELEMDTNTSLEPRTAGEKNEVKSLKMTTYFTSLRNMQVRESPTICWHQVIFLIQCTEFALFSLLFLIEHRDSDFPFLPEIKSYFQFAHQLKI